MDNSISILSESLDNKIEVLKAIQEYNIRQKDAFSKEQIDMGSFDAAIDEKDSLIERLIKLDEGFENLYQRVAEELKNNRQLYATQIRAMQDKIAHITELSASIQAEEARNKQLVEAYFAKAKSGLGQGRKVTRAAYGYYKNASSGHESIFDLKN